MKTKIIEPGTDRWPAPEQPNRTAMKTNQRLILMFLLWTLAVPGLAQTSKLDRDFNRVSVAGMNDFGQVKLLAERGNINAQLKVASACMGSHLYANALKWYSAAADQGLLEARYQKGHLLLFGCQGDTPDQCVSAKPAEGLQLIYMAATNCHPAARFDLGRALKDGCGCPSDRITAYAWFAVCAEAGDAASHESMNALALQLSPENIRQALACVREIKAGHWPPLPASAAMVALPGGQVDIKLKLSGVICSPGGNLAIINKRTLGEGESSQFMTDRKDLVAVTCQRILPDAVEVLVAGEAQSRTLANALR